MTDKKAEDAFMAVAVAPSGTTAHELGAALLAACTHTQIAHVGALRILSDGKKWTAVECSVRLEVARLPAVRLALEQALGDTIDSAILPAQGRRKRLLVSDMDSTIIQQECLDELAAYAGLKDEIAAITARAMAGELDFEAALAERVGRLKGLSLDALEACYRDRISLMPGAQTLAATMTAHGAHCLLVSGGFTYFTSRVADAAGFHSDRANRLLDDGATLTGEVGQPILGRAAKLAALDEAAVGLSLTRADTLAMGDGANDLAMIEAAGLGLAVHAKPVVTAAADAAIKVTDLTTVLYFQGYRNDQIVWRD